MRTLRNLVLAFGALLLLNAAPPDVALTDENGRAVRFYSDIAKGRTVAINFIFTSCSTICQPMSGTFAKAETLLGDRNARLVSISIDPESDTPQRLAEWKKRFRGGKSWTLLTGSQSEIDKLRKALGVFTPDRISHSPTVVVLDDVHGGTTRVNGLANAKAIIDAIDSLRPSETRGRELFMNGPPGGATIGDATVEAAMACASCHGASGRGRTEGGIAAPEITWEALSRSSKKRAAYDARHVIRAVTLGFDSSGNTLAAAMPRYRLTRADADELIAYLRRLDTLREPGITDDTIRIGALVPEQFRSLLQSWADNVNANGGIYARRIEMRFDEEDVFVALRHPERSRGTWGMGGTRLMSRAPARAGSSTTLGMTVVDDLDPIHAARLIEETLRRAGGGVTRESFAETLKSVRR